MGLRSLPRRRCLQQRIWCLLRCGNHPRSLVVCLDQFITSQFSATSILLGYQLHAPIVPDWEGMASATTVGASHHWPLVTSGPCIYNCRPASVVQRVAADQAGHQLTLVSFRLADGAVLLQFNAVLCEGMRQGPSRGCGHTKATDCVPWMVQVDCGRVRLLFRKKVPPSGTCVQYGGCRGRGLSHGNDAHWDWRNCSNNQLPQCCNCCV